MAERTWIGGAEAIAQVTDWVFGGTWEANDEIHVTIGTRTVSVVAGDTVITTVADNVLAALQAAQLPEFQEITWSKVSTNTVRGTSVTPGVPFVATLLTTESGGGAADAQTINGSASSAGVATVAGTGPHHASNPQNWSGGVLPTNGDTIIFAASRVACLYELDFLAALTGTTVRQYMSFTAQLGLPPYNTNGGYHEYRPRYFTVDGGAAQLGLGDGAGSPRFMLDFGATAYVADVYGAGPPESSEEVATFLLGSHADNVLTVNRGRVGVAIYPGEDSSLDLLNVGYRDNPAGDAYVVCGAGMSALDTIDQSGGTCRTSTNSTALNMTGGEHFRMGTSTLGSLSIDAGACRYMSDGTIASAKVGSNGVLDFSQDQRAREVTALELHEQFEYHDPFGTVDLPNGIDFVRCTPRDGVFHVRPHQNWTPDAI